jgi:hypothetical protein
MGYCIACNMLYNGVYLDKENMMKICAECKHKLFKGAIWYDQYCTAIENSKAKDPVSGKMRYVETNDFGDQYYTYHKHPYCRDINNGSCRKFEKAK